MLKSWLLPGGMAAAAGEGQAHSQYHSATHQHTTDPVFPIGASVAGWHEPWDNVGYSWEAETAALLLRLTDTATAAILCLQCLAPCLSIKSVSCFTLCAFRAEVLAIYCIIDFF